MKPIKPMPTRKLTLNRESLRQLTPRSLAPDELVQVVGGTDWQGDIMRTRCPLMSNMY